MPRKPRLPNSAHHARDQRIYGTWLVDHNIRLRELAATESLTISRIAQIIKEQRGKEGKHHVT